MPVPHGHRRDQTNGGENIGISGNGEVSDCSDQTSHSIEGKKSRGGGETICHISGRRLPWVYKAHLKAHLIIEGLNQIITLRTLGDSAFLPLAKSTVTLCPMSPKNVSAYAQGTLGFGSFAVDL